MSPQEIAEIRRQSDERTDLFTDQRRLDLKPGATQTANSALQVTRVFTSSLIPTTATSTTSTVKHRPAPWASGGPESYAVVVESRRKTAKELDLYNPAACQAARSG